MFPPFLDLLSHAPKVVACNKEVVCRQKSSSRCRKRGIHWCATQNFPDIFSNVNLTVFKKFSDDYVTWHTFRGVYFAVYPRSVCKKIRLIVPEKKPSIASNSVGRYFSAHLTGRNSPFLLKDQLLPQLDAFQDLVVEITFWTKFRKEKIFNWSFRMWHTAALGD